MTEKKQKWKNEESFITTPYTHLPFTPSELPINIHKTHDHQRDITIENDDDHRLTMIGKINNGVSPFKGISPKSSPWKQDKEDTTLNPL